MKRIYAFLLLASTFACQSDLPFEEDRGEVFTTDDDGDPVIEDVDIDNRGFGLNNSFCYGYSLPDEPLAEIDLPPSFPESHDLSRLLPPVLSQGDQGSCVGWATGYYMKSYQENLEDSETTGAFSNKQLSPSFVFNQIKLAPCDGAQIADAMELLLKKGVPDLNVMPYDEDQCDQQPTEFQQQLAMQNKIESYFALNGNLLMEQTKAYLLQNQPVVIALLIDTNYFGARDENGLAIYRKFIKEDGAHAMLVVGFDDRKQAFKAVNSWGRSWGNQGFVWIDYKAFEEAMNPNSDFKVLCEAWVSEDVTFVNQPL